MDSCLLMHYDECCFFNFVITKNIKRAVNLISVKVNQKKPYFIFAKLLKHYESAAKRINLIFR
jgi:hypothetical protein